MARSGELRLAADHLARMVEAKVLDGVAELVWNSLDAEATEVTVDVRYTSAGAVEEVSVTDNGHGFAPDEVEGLMSSLGGSHKASKGDRKTRNGARLLHGSKGEGRFQAFALGDRATWESVSVVDAVAHLTRLTIRRDDLQHFEWDSELTSRPAGTTVTIVAGMREPRDLTTDKAPIELLQRLALYLTQYPEVRVSFDGNRLDPDDLIERKDEIPVDFESDLGPLSVTVIEWSQRVARALFLCDENGATLHEVEPRIQAPGFNFTAYLRWAGFREHEADLALADTGSPVTGPALDAARKALREHFRARALDARRSVVREWRDEDVHPYPEPPTNETQRAEQALFNFVAVSAADAVNRIRDRQAKALSLSTMKHVLASDPGSLEVIFREILALPEGKLAELRDLLRRTRLTSLVDAMKKVTGRLEFIAGLELMLFDDETAPDVLERVHLQELLAAEPWLFGEEFSLHVSDKGLTTLLKTHIGLLERDDLVQAPVLDDQGRPRRIDLMFGRSLEQNRNRREHLVVEIKRPTVTIGQDELNQIENYARAVAADPRFDKETTEWDFIVVSTELDDYVSYRVRQPNRKHGLALESPNGHLRVWAHPWNAIIGEARHRLKFVRDQLEYDPGTDEAVGYLRKNYPEFVPDALGIARERMQSV